MIYILSDNPSWEGFTKGKEAARLNVKATHYNNNQSGAYFCFNLKSLIRGGAKKLDCSEWDFTRNDGNLYSIRQNGTRQNVMQMIKGRFMLAARHVDTDALGRPNPPMTLDNQNNQFVNWTNWSTCSECGQGIQAKAQITILDLYDPAGTRMSKAFITAGESYSQSLTSGSQWCAPKVEIRNTNEKDLIDAPNNVYVITKWDFDGLLYASPTATPVSLTHYNDDKLHPNAGNYDHMPIKVNRTVRQGAFGGQSDGWKKGVCSGWKKTDETIYGVPGGCDHMCVHELQEIEVKSEDEDPTAKKQYFVKGLYWPQMCAGNYMEFKFTASVENSKDGVKASSTEVMGTFDGTFKSKPFEYNAKLGWQSTKPQASGKNLMPPTPMIKNFGTLLAASAKEDIVFNMGVHNASIGRIKAKPSDVVTAWVKPEGTSAYTQITEIAEGRPLLEGTSHQTPKLYAGTFPAISYNHSKDWYTSATPAKAVGKVMTSYITNSPAGFARGDWKFVFKFDLENVNCPADVVTDTLELQILFNLPSSIYIPRDSEISP